MVLNCVAHKCYNLHDKRIPISFHSFPFKRPKILELWVGAVGREQWYPSKSSRLCSEHFLPTDYLEKPGCTAKILKPDAVPSIFSFPKPLEKFTPIEEIIKHEQEDLPDPTDIDVSSTPIESANKFVDKKTQTTADKKTQTTADKQTQTTEDNTSILLLRKKIKSLKQKVRRKDMTISSMKEIIKKTKNRGHSLRPFWELARLLTQVNSDNLNDG